MSDTVEVICFVFPNGEVFHAEHTENLSAQKVVDAWKEFHPEHANDARLLGGFVRIVMLRADYQRIPATSFSHALFEAARG